MFPIHVPGCGIRRFSRQIPPAEPLIRCVIVACGRRSQLSFQQMASWYRLLQNNQFHFLLLFVYLFSMPLTAVFCPYLYIRHAYLFSLMKIDR